MNCEKMNIEKYHTDYAPPADSNNNSRQAVSLGQPNQRLQTATVPTPPAVATAAVVSPPFKDNDAITFAIVDQIGYEIKYKMRRHHGMSKAFNIYSQRREIPYFPEIYFQTEDGKYISPDATPDMIRLKQNSRIYCIHPTAADKEEGCRGNNCEQVLNETITDSFEESGTFKGTISTNTGMPHGQGRMAYDEGEEQFARVYNGDWHHGCWHGYGSVVFSNGDTYEGEFEFNRRHGTGVYRWNDGRVYYGQFSENKHHGRGKLTWLDGTVYEGEFVDHQRDGQGTYMFADGEKYEGSWKNEKRNGSGTYTFANGGEYEGMWKDGIFNGIGTLWRQDGYYYHGEWRAGMRHGIGHETCPNDKTGHVGHWINDEPVRGAALKNKVVSKKRTVTKKTTTTKKKKKTAKQNSTKSASVLINFSSLSINEKDAFEQPMNF